MMKAMNNEQLIFSICMSAYRKYAEKDD